VDKKHASNLEQLVCSNRWQGQPLPKLGKLLPQKKTKNLAQKIMLRIRGGLIESFAEFYGEQLPASSDSINIFFGDIVVLQPPFNKQRKGGRKGALKINK